MRLDVSVVPIWCWSPREVLESFRFLVCIGILKKQALIPVKGWFISRVDGLASENEDKQAKSKASFFHVLNTGSQKKVYPRIQVYLPTSKDLDLGWVFPLLVV